jgi:gliding motility-associated-like protein
MRLTALLLLLWFLPAGLLSGQAHFWPFGQGLGLDFNQNPPQLRSVPWQRTSTPQFQSDMNQCSVFEDDSGQVVLYFLNGKYMDANDNVIFSVANYHRAPELILTDFGNMVGSKQSSFFRFNDTLYHTYTSGVPFVSNLPIYGRTNNLKIYLRSFVNINGTWSVNLVDSFPRINNSVDFQNVFSIVDHHPDSAKYVLFSGVEKGRINIPGEFEAASKKILTITPSGFIEAPLSLSTSTLYFIYQCSAYSNLTKSIYSHHDNYPGINYVNRYEPVFLSGSNLSTVVSKDSMLIFSPKDTILTFTSPRVCRIGPNQRYLFISMMVKNGQPDFIHRLIRFDLLATSQIEWNATAVDLGVPSSLYINDMQFGPDGHLYFLSSDDFDRVTPRADCNKIGRIINPISLDTSQISCQENFLTTQPWQAYAMFPDLTSRQRQHGTFEMLYACQDSVQFRLDFGRGVDSVIWNFGEPALGAANTSQDLDPVVAYPQAGTYFVRVELWWRGEVLHTLSDSVEVLPVIDFSLPEDTILCEGEELLLDVAQNFSVQYRWNTGDTAGQITVDSAGWYQVELTNACGQMSDSIWVDYIPDPQVSLRDTSLCEQDSNLLVSLPYNENYFYRWSTGADSSAIAINDSGTYFVTYGSYCDSISESFSIEKRPCSCELFIPNAFTPNGDGLNDEFIIVSPCEELEFELLIFNRWGILVHQQSSGTPSWDGYFNGELTPGVYVYKINYRGRSMAGPVEGKESGTLTLIR